MYLIQINKAIIINSRTVRAIEPKTIVGTKLSKSIPRLSATSSFELFESESSYVLFVRFLKVVRILIVLFEDKV
jgi:hypothetical protein